jgi:hypothetical protein
MVDEERMKAFCHCQPSAGSVPADAFGFAVTFAVGQATATQAGRTNVVVAVVVRGSGL